MNQSCGFELISLAFDSISIHAFAIRFDSKLQKFEDPLKLLMTVLAKNFLEDVVVYELKPKDLTNKAARWLLKKVEVRDQMLEITLGL